MEREYVPRSFAYVSPIRCGVLRFPQVGPSVLKKKGVLGKAGNYFSKEAKEEVAILLTNSLEKKNIMKNTSTFSEEKLIWTWSNQDFMHDYMFDYLRSVPEGMCSHTLAEALKKPEERENKISHKGICTRTACENLKLPALLNTFLTESMTPSERHNRVTAFLEKFPVTREIVLFDESSAVCSENGKMVCGGIKKKTMRHIGNSNGIPLFCFSVEFNADSNLERLKNVLRPLILTGMRKEVNRSFILQYLSSDNKDDLMEWWKVVSQNLSGSSNVDYSKEVESRCNQKAIKALKKNMEPKMQRKEEEEKSGRSCCIIREETLHSAPEFSMDFGRSPEVLEVVCESALSLEELEAYLIPQQNSKQVDKYLDVFLFGSTESKFDVKVNKEFAAIVEPKNSRGKTVDRFGKKTQTMVVQLNQESKLEQDMFSSLLPIPDAIKQLPFVQKVASFITSYALSVAPSLDKGVTEEYKLKRFFNLEKSYYFFDSQSQGFAITWTSLNDKSTFSEGLAASGVESKVDQMIMKVEAVKKNEENEIRNFHFQLVNEKSKLRQRFKDTQVSKERVPNAIWSDSEKDEGSLAMCRQEEFMFRLLTGQEKAKLETIQLVNKSISSLTKLGFKNSEKLFNEMIETIKKAAISSNIVIMTAGLCVLHRLMQPQKHTVEPVQSRLINSATKAFVDLVSKLSELLKQTQIVFTMLKHAVDLLSPLLEPKEQQKKEIFYVHVEAALFLKKVVDRVSENTRFEMCAAEVLAPTSEMERRANVIYGNRKALLLEEALKKEEFPKEVEFLYNSPEWRKVERKQNKDGYFYEFEVEENEKRVKVYADAKNLLRKTKEFTSLQSMNQTYSICDAGSSLLKSKEAGKSEGSSSFEDQRVELNAELNEARISEAKLTGRLQSLAHYLDEVAPTMKTKISLCVRVDARKVYGEDLLEKRPYLGRIWTSSLVDGLQQGLNQFHKVFTSDVEEFIPGSSS